MAGSGDEVLDFGKGSAPVCGEVGGVAGLGALILHLGADGGKGGPKDGAEDVGRRGGGDVEELGDEPAAPATGA